MFPHRFRLSSAVAAAALLLAVGACSEEATGPEDEGLSALLSVVPTGGATNVDPSEPIVVEFTHAIGVGMEAYAALHVGDVNGPEVPGTWTASEDRTTMTFTPATALKPATTYTVHIGGGMMDDQGNMINLDQHGLGMGGMWATSSMMSGGMGMGDGGTHSHMGAGWDHPSNGSSGMVFSFTTAG